MKKLLILALLIVGCEEPSQHGCLDGQATNYDATASIDNNTCTYIDSCGVVDIDLTNDCVQDCAGEWGGDGLTEVELWGEVYDIATTTEIDLWNSGLTGSIPPEIGCLTNLTNLSLFNNQLTGLIPSTIGI